MYPGIDVDLSAGGRAASAAPEQWPLDHGSEGRTQDGGTVAVYSDITKLKQREMARTSLSNIDPLIVGRRGFRNLPRI